jgi:hypothetical protein
MGHPDVRLSIVSLYYLHSWYLLSISSSKILPFYCYYFYVIAIIIVIVVRIVVIIIIIRIRIRIILLVLALNGSKFW